MTTLKWPWPWFQRYTRLAARSPVGAVVLHVGRHQGERGSTWLVREVWPWSDQHRQGDPTTQWIVGTRHEAPGSVQEIPPYALGRLDFGQGPWSDYAWGVVRLRDQIVPLDVLDLIGSGLHRLRLPQGQPVASAALEEALREEAGRERHSRTVGALGGEAVWQRLVERRIGLAGCGRTGSLVATSLARLGVRELVLIDPDCVEPHNLGEMDGVTAADVGRPKVEALADELRRIQSLPPMDLMPLALSVEAPESRRAIADCDIAISAVDEDAPRLVVGWSALYQHQVLLDIGTGVHRGPSAEALSPPTRSGRANPHPRRMGADVRLILPGDGCLFCLGGVARYREALESLVAPPGEHAGPDDWRRQRAGSLRSLNQMAAGLGLQLLQDLASGVVPGSRWARLEVDDTGRLTVLEPRSGTGSGRLCEWCARAGRGDYAVQVV
jgi:hypothetical protein